MGRPALDVGAQLPRLGTQTRALANAAASAGWLFTARGAGDPRLVQGQVVLGDLFGTLGLNAAVGRVMTKEESPSHPGGARVAVVSHQILDGAIGRGAG